MTDFFQNLRDVALGLKDMPKVLEELRDTRAVLAQYAELVQSYTETLIEVKKQLDSITSKLPLK